MSAAGTRNWRAKQKRNGQCIDCTRPVVSNKRHAVGVYCEFHRDLHREQSRLKRIRERGPSKRYLQLSMDAFVGLSPADLSYAAALIDGEGHLGVTRYKNEVRLTVNVSMVDREPLDFMSRLFGGNVRPKKRQADNQPQVAWARSARAAGAIAKAILPYLRIARKVSVAHRMVRMAEVLEIPYNLSNKEVDAAIARREQVKREVLGEAVPYRIDTVKVA